MSTEIAVRARRRIAAHRGPCPDIDRVVSETKAAEILGYSKDTLRREFRAGKAPARVRLSRKRIGYRLSVLYAFLDARTEQPGSPK
jgi:predicted DNA-binding transcriptional regulator AlpA